MTSRYALHVEKWGQGCGGPNCSIAGKIVLARGQLPCDVLFVGEAPGPSEDVIGRPFVGPAGKLLDAIIRKALPKQVRYALTNLVCCIPRDEEGNKALEPDVESIMCCAPRLQEFLEIANPRLLVNVGAMAKDWLKPGFRNPVKVEPSVKQVHITHPAAIIRANIAARDIMSHRCIVTLSNAVEEILNDAQ